MTKYFLEERLIHMSSALEYLLPSDYIVVAIKIEYTGKKSKRIVTLDTF